MFTTVGKLRCVAAGALVVLSVSGCATNARVAQLEGDIKDVRRTAEFALAEAKDAKERARSADDRSLRTEEMVNRSFHHAMRK